MTRPSPAEAGPGGGIEGTIARGHSSSVGQGGKSDPYRTSPVKRTRRTKAQMAALHDAIVEAVAIDSPVSVRGVFYRLVTMGAVPKDEKRGYQPVQRELVKLRREGRVPYESITDGTRWTLKPDTYESPEAALRATARLYRRDLWSRSDSRLMVFSEKDAISGVVSPVLAEWDVALGIVRGYSSLSFTWSVAQSLSSTRRNVLAQLGDHDPSGVDAWRQFCEEVRRLAGPDVLIDFERLAVTPEQVEELELPTRPTKQSDSRSKGWQGGSVEVDAIPPSTLRGVVEDFIDRYIDVEHLAHLELVERYEREQLADMARQMGRAS
jgi:hypothetical protein